MVYRKVLQFDVCSNCYTYQFTDCLPIERSMRCNKFGYLSVTYLVNSFSTKYPVVFQTPLLMPHGMCTVHACCSGVLSLHLFHHALELRDLSNYRRPCLSAMKMLDWCASSTRRLLVHNLINNLLHFTQVFNIAISLSSTQHYLVFESLLQFMYIYIPQNLIQLNIYSRKYYCYTQHYCRHCDMSHKL